MAKRQPLEISEEELLELETISRSSKAEKRMVERSKIILLWQSGSSFAQTQAILGVSQMVVNKWRKRFIKYRIEGLRDAPRSGKPPVFSAATKATVIKLATRKPKDGYTSWSQRRIAKEVGMSQGKVQQILKQADLKPHKVDYWCGKSTDVEFENKMLNIVGLYMNPPENALVLSVDEKTQIQALDRTQPLLPLKTGRPKRLTSTYKRNGTVALLAALSVHKGEVTARTVDKNNAQNFLLFLKDLYRKYPGKHLHVIVDNLTVHKHKMVVQWVTSKRRMTLHYTPTYSSWLNQIEIWFNILTKDVLKGGVWKSKKQLVDQLMEYVKTYNEQRAKPFKWTYTGQPLAI
ncbi:IS630 family transposase [Niabella yanshanensis]|uniref:IS630 family transposase n=1 Tax=Niabella yanshanensis TaxID=577386 RepID=A0ABZ0W821_9BACT|nr:IS630 family transposase [Niabella yanshanensis]WQD38758.1 IS630 family transposase [Niabella yanshanensis]